MRAEHFLSAELWEQGEQGGNFADQQKPAGDPPHPEGVRPEAQLAERAAQSQPIFHGGGAVDEEDHVPISLMIELFQLHNLPVFISVIISVIIVS